MNGKDWMKNQRWGVFTHYLYHEQNKAGSLTNMGVGTTDWNDCVDAFDVKRLAAQLHEVGAHYLFFTLMQGKRFMCAPNATFDRITGYKPGEACSRRDLIADLLDALAPYDIPLCLYYTGDGPYQDPIAGPAMGYASQEDKVTKEFVQNWADVAKEYSLRYGSAIKAWWVDGCYDWFGYNDEMLSPYVPAMKAGNPDAILAFNGGVKMGVFKRTVHDDFTCGEMNSFEDIPTSRFIDGAQWHILAPIGISVTENTWEAWCKPGCKHTPDYMKDYVRKVNAVGGAVTIDVALYRDGHLDPEQMALLKNID